MTSNEQAEPRATSLQTARVADRFVDLADTLVDDFDVVELLDRLVADCVDLLEVSAAGILLRNLDGALEVVASSSEASRLMEVFQLEAEEGPCIEAVTSGVAARFDDLATLHSRWPAFADAVDQVGFAAVHANPLRLRTETIGALNMFNTGDITLTAQDHRLAQALADVATIGILQQRSISRASVLTEQLQLALNSRIAVEQAKGVISEYGKVDMGAAFDALRGYAREHQAKLSDVAGQVVDRRLDPAELIPAGD